MASWSSIYPKARFENEWPDFKRSSTVHNSVQPDPERKRKSKSKFKIDLLQLTQSNTSETEGVNNAFNIDEIRNNEPIVTGQFVGNNEDTQEVLNRILDGSSTFRKARRVTALVVRAIKNIFQKKKINGPISVPEVHDAEKRLIKMSQAEMDVTGKRMQNIIPFVDKDGIWKAKGRLENARQLPQALRNPIILLNSDPLVKLLLRHHHQKLAHCGYKRLMVEIRRWYWVIGPRDVARNHAKACIPCKLMRKRACEQYMGQLPVYRTDIKHPAFANTALDLFGPFEIKLGRKTIKEAWCRIFTCMTSRAILLELLYGQIYRYVPDGIQKIFMYQRTSEVSLVGPWDEFCWFPKIPAGDGGELGHTED